MQTIMQVKSNQSKLTPNYMDDKISEKVIKTITTVCYLCNYSKCHSNEKKLSFFEYIKVKQNIIKIQTKS